MQEKLSTNTRSFRAAGRCFARELSLEEILQVSGGEQTATTYNSVDVATGKSDGDGSDTGIDYPPTW